MITIKEIAERIGVSPTTVSNVINGRTGKMSEETRKRVEAALVEYHYVGESRKEDPNAEMKLIAMDFYLGQNKDVMTDPFCSTLLGAVMRELRELGRYVVSASHEDEDEIIRKLASRNVEGGIVLGCPPEKCLDLCRRTAKPVVFIDSGDGEYDNVGLQDMQGAYEMTSYLIRQGHRRIAFFNDHGGFTPSNRERLLGFRLAMEQHGLEIFQEDVYQLPLERNLRYEILRQFARKKAGRECTAAFFVCDLFANEAISIFFSQGISVPEQISVTGFDDNIYARLSRPRLTTVRQNPEEKAKEAVKLLMKRIYGEAVQVYSLHLPTELIVRDSVRYIGQEKEADR
ncbi:MAG: LacI family DNA-binding transcriptional regulator [Lachnospiraceae bacterium]|nr:LacI family DNA-binding transcriptional regulator [Lachnospiraceae bacterium]